MDSTSLVFTSDMVIMKVKVFKYSMVCL